MLEHLLQQHGYIFVYIGTILEADATVIAATFLAHRGYMRMAGVLIIAALASVTVSHIWFWLARRRGQSMLERMTSRHKRYGRLRDWVCRNGYVLVFCCRFMWGLRLAIPAACGATGMHAGRFALVDAAGAAVWIMIVGTAGYAIAHAIASMWANIRRYEDVIALTLLGIVSLVMMWRGRDAEREIKVLRKPEKIGVEAVSHIVRGRAGHRIIGLRLNELPPVSTET